MNERAIGEPHEGADGGIYQQFELLDDYSHLNPWKRPPKIVWRQIKEAKSINNDRSDDRKSLSDYYNLKGRDIRELKGKHKGRPVAVLCNGASLSRHDLLEIPFRTIGMNRTFVGFPGYEGPQPDYYVYIDIPWGNKITQGPTVINASQDPKPMYYQIVKSWRMKPWSWDIWRDGAIPVNTGCLALQVAAYLGFNPIYILGMDYAANRALKDSDWEQELHFNNTPSSKGLQTQPDWLRRAEEAVAGKLDVYFVGSPDNGSDAFPHITFEEMLRNA